MVRGGDPWSSAFGLVSGRSLPGEGEVPGLHSQRRTTLSVPVCISFVAFLAETPHRVASESWFGEVRLFADSVDSPCCSSVEWKHPTFADFAALRILTLIGAQPSCTTKLCSSFHEKRKQLAFSPPAIYSWTVK